MGYKRTSGTPRKFSLDGIPFSLMADANLSEKPSGYENEAIATSGAGMIKKTKIIRTLESVTLGTDALEREVLANFADGTDTMTCSYVNAAGDKYTTPACAINIESNETETNTTTLVVHPVEPWTVALA